VDTITKYCDATCICIALIIALVIILIIVSRKINVQITQTQGQAATQIQKKTFLVIVRQAIVNISVSIVVTLTVTISIDIAFNLKIIDTLCLWFRRSTVDTSPCSQHEGTVAQMSGIYDTDPANDAYIKGGLNESQLALLDKVLIHEFNNGGVRLSGFQLKAIVKDDQQVVAGYSRWRTCKDLMRSNGNVIYPVEKK